MSISANKTILYAADVSVLAEPALFAAAYAMASPERKEKADRYCPESSKRQTLGAEVLLRYALKEAGCAEFPDAMPCTEYGKPFLPDEGIYFNISHSGDWVVCAVSGCDVGCDVEKVRPVELNTGRRFHPGEYEDILSQESAEKRQARFFRYWTLKESFMKATGLGLRLPLDAFQIMIGEEISVQQSLNERSYFFMEFDSFPGYICAVCTAGGLGDVELKIVDLREQFKRQP